MQTTLRHRVRTAIANEALQAALDANAQRRITGRAAALESLPDWETRRKRARSVREAVIAQLAAYVDQFADRAQRNGFQVHRAPDAAEAVRLVLDIARSTGPKPLVAKSKSMVSEEIGLNHALETAGIQVVETDLGEYIVQLRGERPSHIITPAVHLRRHEVGQLFHDRLGVPYTEDIAEMTATARRVLRDVFLSATVGLSGVNFGIVESGSLCLVTNEGNGRMVTTLPKVHIALMGIERLVPEMKDLALMLSLLPRSATGQKLTVYTQIITRPLPDQQRHLILVDNGRSRLQESAMREALYCIRCGACLNACPVFRELGGHAYGSVYAGPIGSVISPTFFGPEHAALAQASTLCGACRDACPVEIDLPKLLTRVRAGMAPRSLGLGDDHGLTQPGGQSLSWLTATFLRLFGLLAPHPPLFAAAQRLGGWLFGLIAPRGNWLRLPAATRWGLSKDIPPFARRPFRSRFAAAAAPTAASTMSEAMAPVPPPVREAVAPEALEYQSERELTRVGGHLIRVTEVTLVAAMTDVLRGAGAERAHISAGTLDERILAAAGIAVSSTADPSIRFGITGAVCGIADTGSVMLVDGEGQPLHASLLPEVHVAVLSREKILPTLADALELQSLRNARAAVVITGPSRTSDIEMTHTIGVHGPRELHVLLVDQ